MTTAPVIDRGTVIHDLSRLPDVFTSHAMVVSTGEAAMGNVAMDTYRPIPLATFFWDAWLAGRSPWAYHLTNLTLHALVVFLLHGLLRRALPRASRGAVALGALFFGCAPWLAEAHVWINGRSDPLAALFLLAAIRMAGSPGRVALAGVALASLAALMSKEIAVLGLPFVALLPAAVDRDPARARRALGAAGVALVAYLALRGAALDGLRTHGDGQLARVLPNLPLLLLDGAAHLLLPSEYALRSLSDDYAGVGVGARVAATGACVALALGALLGLRRAPVLAAGLLLAGATMAPAVMITEGLWPGFGRYLYVPALGVALSLTALVRRAEAAGRGRIAKLIVGAVVVFSAPLLVLATRDYRSKRDALRPRDGGRAGAGLGAGLPGARTQASRPLPGGDPPARAGVRVGPE